MIALENADEISSILDRFTKQKATEIPPELGKYINHVAKTGDTVYRWSAIQYLFREKIKTVIQEFQDTTTKVEDLPRCPNVDDFNFEVMKKTLFERFDNFQSAPFTIQRLCELLAHPKKHYNRIDKFMRALEKNILVGNVETNQSAVDIERDEEDQIVASEVNIDEAIDKLNAENGDKKSEEIIVDQNGHVDEKDVHGKDADGKDVDGKDVDEPKGAEQADEAMVEEKTEIKAAVEPDSAPENGAPSTDDAADPTASEAVANEAEKASDADAATEEKLDEAKPIVDSSSDVVQNIEKPEVVEAGEASGSVAVDSTQNLEEASVEMKDIEGEKSAETATVEDDVKSSAEETPISTTDELPKASIVVVAEPSSEEPVKLPAEAPKHDVIPEKPLTPKRSREDDDEDGGDLDDGEHTAKKIKSDSADDEVESAKVDSSESKEDVMDTAPVVEAVAATAESVAQPTEPEAEKIIEDSDIVAEQSATEPNDAEKAPIPVVNDAPVVPVVVPAPAALDEATPPTDGKTETDASDKIPVETPADVEAPTDVEAKSDTISAENVDAKGVDETVAVSGKAEALVDVVAPTAMEE